MTSLPNELLQTNSIYGDSYNPPANHVHAPSIDLSTPSTLSSRDNLSSRLDNNDLNYIHDASQYPSHLSRDNILF